MAGVVRIEDMHAAAEGGLSRACADVDGRLLWFESADVELRPVPEAFACAMLPAAVERESRLTLDRTIDPGWCTNVTALQDVWRAWWRYRKVGVHPQGGPNGHMPRAKGAALCFSGGVDSFYTLLRGGLAFDHLVFVHGYDMALADVRRAAAMERSLRAVAGAVGARAVMVRTNLREHPTFAVTNWHRSHGGALAAVGHLLSHAVGTLTISSSYPLCYEHPWGTHWKTDPLWSSPRLDVVHSGAEHWRADKLRAIVGEELVRRHLRVCYKNLSPEGNCGRCEKCIRTMLILAQADQLQHFPVFDGGVHLSVRIDGLRRLRPDLIPVYEGFMRQTSDRQVGTALEALIARTRSRPSRVAGWARDLMSSTGHTVRRRLRNWRVLP